MLVHFAKIRYGDRVTELEMEIMSEWFAKIDQHPDEWQVPVEMTKYPKEIKVFWRTYKEATDMLDTVCIRIATRLWPEDIKCAVGELKWAIEELAYDAEHLNKCMQEMAEALKVAEKSEVEIESSSHVEPHAYRNDKAHTESAIDGKNRTWKYERQLRKSMNVKMEAFSSGAKVR